MWLGKRIYLKKDLIDDGMSTSWYMDKGLTYRPSIE